MYILLFSYIYSAYRPNYIQIITPSGKNLHLGSNVLSESNSEAVLNLFRDRLSPCLGINLKQHPISPVDIIYMEKPKTTTHSKYSTVYHKVRPSETA